MVAKPIEPLVLHDEGGLPMLVRPDTISAVAGPMVEARQQAIKAGQPLKGGMIWMIGRVGMSTQENQRKLVGIIDGQEGHMAPQQRLSLVLRDPGNSPICFRPSHIAAISALPVQTRRQLTVRGITPTGSTIWTVGGHGMLVRESVDTVMALLERTVKRETVETMKEMEEDPLVGFEPKVVGPSTTVPSSDKKNGEAASADSDDQE